MLEEHGLTLPQETTPLRGLDRGEQLNWRVRELEKVLQSRAEGVLQASRPDSQHSANAHPTLALV